MLGYGFWQRQYGGDTSVIGKTVRVNQHPATVIGILPFDFVGLDPEHGELNEVWLPIKKITYFVNESKLLTSFDASNSGVHMFGRLKPGISFKGAEASFSRWRKNCCASTLVICKKGKACGRTGRLRRSHGAV